MKQPCARDCPDRSPTCHAECARWAEFEAWKREEYARREVEFYANLFSPEHERAVRRSMKQIVKKPGRSGKY